jgi:hypothetical protein
VKKKTVKRQLKDSWISLDWFYWLKDKKQKTKDKRTSRANSATTKISDDNAG